jgi:hypothetical protein
MAKYAKTATYQMAKLSEFLDKLRAHRTAMLTCSAILIYCGSGMSNATPTTAATPPALLIGGPTAS